MEITFQIWEINTKDSLLISNAFAGAHGVFLAFDLTNRESFLQSIDDWIEILSMELNKRSEKPSSVILIGLKADLSKKIYESEINDKLNYFTGRINQNVDFYTISSTDISTGSMKPTDLFKNIANSYINKLGVDSNSILLKVALFGESGVGKSTLISQLTGQTLSDEQIGSIGSDFTTYSIKIDQKPSNYQKREQSILSSPSDSLDGNVIDTNETSKPASSSGLHDGMLKELSKLKDVFLTEEKEKKSEISTITNEDDELEERSDLDVLIDEKKTTEAPGGRVTEFKTETEPLFQPRSGPISTETIEKEEKKPLPPPSPVSDIDDTADDSPNLLKKTESVDDLGEEGLQPPMPKPAPKREESTNDLKRKHKGKKKDKFPPPKPSPRPTEKEIFEEPEIVEMIDERTINTSISYFDKMSVYKNFNLLVHLSHAKIKKEKTKTNILTGERKTQKQEELTFKEESVIVVPIFPGCLVSPQSRRANLKNSDQKLNFIVTPLVQGKIDGKIEFQSLQQETLHIIETPCESNQTRIARIIAIAGTTVGAIPAAFNFFLDFNMNQVILDNLSPYLEQSVVNNLSSINFLLYIQIAIIVLSLGLAFLLVRRRRPRQQEFSQNVDRESLETTQLG